MEVMPYNSSAAVRAHLNLTTRWFSKEDWSNMRNYMTETFSEEELSEFRNITARILSEEVLSRLRNESLEALESMIYFGNAFGMFLSIVNVFLSIILVFLVSKYTFQAISELNWLYREHNRRLKQELAKKKE